MKLKPWMVAMGMVALALPVSCGRTEVYSMREPEPHASFWSDAGGLRPDASVAADGGSCSGRQVWNLVSRSISTVTLVEGAPPQSGVTERLRVSVRLESACESLAKVEVALNPGGATDFITLRAFAWVLEPACAAESGSANWVVAIPGDTQGNLQVVVSDQNNPAGPLRFVYTRAPCGPAPVCACQSNTPREGAPEGSPCRTDCACAAGLSCLGAPGGMRFCARPCNDLRDCRPGERCVISRPGGPPLSCVRMMEVCPTGAECPAGFTCIQDGGTSNCRDDRVHPTYSQCACDADCPAGYHCSQAYRPHPSCEARCERAGQCPIQGQGLYACSFKATCVPLL